VAKPGGTRRARDCSPKRCRSFTTEGAWAIRAASAVIFDLDGTLFDSEPVYRAAFFETLTEQGYAADERFYSTLVGIATPDRAVMLRRHFGPAFPLAQFIRRYYTRKRRRLEHGIPIMPGALELLEWLAERRVPAAIATSASRATAMLHLSRYQLRGKFAAVITRDDVAQRKPDPAPFLLAAAEMQIRPDCCVAVEDSPSGLAAASAAGMTCLLVPGAPAPRSPTRRCRGVSVVPDLRALREFVSAN
jgi:HAD superfamily hydrolase (TIGR01509 family)